jgi:hypothetical protein
MALFLFLAVIAASTAAFMLNLESLLKAGHFRPLIVVIVAAAMLLSAVRGLCTASGTNPAAATITFLFLMCGLSALGAYGEHGHVMRLTLGAGSFVLLLVAAFYSMRHNHGRPGGGVAA